jgi:hypothetical protein
MTLPLLRQLLICLLDLLDILQDLLQLRVLFFQLLRLRIVLGSLGSFLTISLIKLFK